MVFTIMSSSASLIICTICFSLGAWSRRCQSQTRAVISLGVGLFVNLRFRHVDGAAKHFVTLHRGAVIFRVDLWAPFTVCVCVCVIAVKSSPPCVEVFLCLVGNRKLKYLRTRVLQFLKKIRCLCVHNARVLWAVAKVMVVGYYVIFRMFVWLLWHSEWVRVAMLWVVTRELLSCFKFFLNICGIFVGGC